MGEVFGRHSQAAPALGSEVPATVRVLCSSIGCRAVCCSLHQPCHIRRHVSTLAVVPCLCPVPIKEEEHLLLSKNPKPPQLISQARRNPLRQAFLEKSTPVGTGTKVWDNNFPPALPAQWSVKPQRGTFCSLPCVQGKQGVNKIQ